MELIHEARPLDVVTGDTWVEYRLRVPTRDWSERLAMAVVEMDDGWVVGVESGKWRQRQARPSHKYE
jgi:hypothetical protein